MKKVLAASAGLLLALQAPAAKIAGDDFTYAAGNLAGDNGGFGWNGAWAANTTNTTVTTLAPGTAFSYASGVINLPASPANLSAQISSTAGANTNTSAATRTLSATATAATNVTDVYVSFLMRYSTTAGSLIDAERFYLFFGSAATSTARYDIGVSALGTTDFAVRTSNNAGYTNGGVDVASSATTTYLVVGKLSKASSANFDQFSFWLNPSTPTEGTPTGTSSNPTGDLATLSTLGFGITGLDAGESFQFDNLQIGTTWQDVVTPVPFGVDSSLGLGVLGLAAALRLRRRRACQRN